MAPPEVVMSEVGKPAPNIDLVQPEQYQLLMKPEFSLSRREVILERLAAGQSVVAATLALEFDVSEDAIRRDLRALAAEGLCRRVYGGALPLARPAQPISARINSDLKRKRQLARVAAELVRPGELVFMDCGSTNLAMVDFLPKDIGVIVATNSVDISAAVAKRGGMGLITIGGSVDLAIGGAVDATAVAVIRETNFDLAFVGGCAIAIGFGIAANDHADATFKKMVIKQSRRCALLALTEKFSEEAPYRVGGPSDFDCLVVEANLDNELARELETEGYSLMRAGEGSDLAAVDVGHNFGAAE
ncbi:DeoR/GlpR family DNA-binding transcription regulator (plasmid) [Rhizobium laguerreae]|nr:DeoR/GlpR family DNA-binding transcription regulator [Rhizobium laguerreae]UFW68241.1 DeoR/GlpR family DNA-binding transcription regulator [Rhizobium laguerreae]